jgi:hypothetical protein
MRFAGVTVVGSALLAVAGCPQPATVVEFTNNANASVRVTLFYSDQQDTPEEVLEEFGQTFESDVPAGETRTFSRDCAEIQAVLVNGDLRLLGGIGPETTSNVFRDGSDFGCGDTIRFTFTQSLLGTDLDVAFSRR